MGELQFTTPANENPSGGVNTADIPAARTSSDGPIEGPISDCKTTMSIPALESVPSGNPIKFADE